MIDDMAIRNLSERTIETYIDQVSKFARYFGKSPELLGPEEIRTYQLYLVHDKKVSHSYLNQAVAALRFLYRTTLKREEIIEFIPHSRTPRKLPVVLSLEEVAQFFEVIGKIKYRAILMTAYATGLRTLEVAKLKLTDIDSKRMVIRVEEGKGGKDRYVMLSERLLLILREYWKVNWGAMCRSVMLADIVRSPITPVEIGTAQNARVPPEPNGWSNNKSTCCQFIIFT